MKDRREVVNAVAFSRGSRRRRDHGEANCGGDSSHSMISARSRLSRYSLRNGQIRPTTPASAMSAAEYTAVDQSQSVILGLRRRGRPPRSKPGRAATSARRHWANARPPRPARRRRPRRKPKQIATTGHRYGAFLRSSASSPTAPMVTAKKVMVVDGKLRPRGLPTTATRSGLGRGRLKIALVCSAPYCSSSRKNVDDREAAPSGHEERRDQRDRHHVVLAGRGRQPADRCRPRGRRRRHLLHCAGDAHVTGEIRLHPHANANQHGDRRGDQEGNQG